MTEKEKHLHFRDCRAAQRHILLFGRNTDCAKTFLVYLFVSVTIIYIISPVTNNPKTCTGNDSMFGAAELLILFGSEKFMSGGGVRVYSTDFQSCLSRLDV